MDIVNCPGCGKKMGKAGFVWSGKKKVQRWRCFGCGKLTMKIPHPEEVVGNIPAPAPLPTNMPVSIMIPSDSTLSAEPPKCT